MGLLPTTPSDALPRLDAFALAIIIEAAASSSGRVSKKRRFAALPIDGAKVKLSPFAGCPEILTLTPSKVILDFGV